MIARGIMDIASISAHSEPIIVSMTASCPFPFKSSLCPGRTESAEPGSGAPKKIAGIVSRKVCVTAIAIINTAIIIGSNIFRNRSDSESNKVHTKLT